MNHHFGVNPCHVDVGLGKTIMMLLEKVSEFFIEVWTQLGCDLDFVSRKFR